MKVTFAVTLEPVPLGLVLALYGPLALPHQLLVAVTVVAPSVLLIALVENPVIELPEIETVFATLEGPTQTPWSQPEIVPLAVTEVGYGVNVMSGVFPTTNPRPAPEPVKVLFVNVALTPQPTAPPA